MGGWPTTQQTVQPVPGFETEEGLFRSQKQHKMNIAVCVCGVCVCVKEPVFHAGYS